MGRGGVTVFALFIAFILLSAGSVFAGREYYVSPSGNDANPGTRAEPWRSLEKASAEAGPGDTVNFLPGEHEGILRPGTSGTEEAPVVFRAAERRKAVLIGDGGNEPAVHIDGLSHVILEGLHIRQQTAGAQWATIERSSYVDIKDCLADFDGVATRWRLFLINRCEQVRILDSEFRHVSGDMLNISQSSHVLIEGNAIARAGHSPLVLFGYERREDPRERYGTNRYVTIRGNILHAGWGRAGEIFGDMDILIEDNIITNQFNSGRSAGPRAQYMAKRAIFRNNRLYRNWGGPLSHSPWRDVGYVRDFRAYNNIFDDNLEMGIHINPRHEAVGNVIYKNSVFYRNDPYGAWLQLNLTGGTAEDIRFINNCITGGAPNAPGTIRFGGAPFSVRQESHPALKDIFEGNIDLTPGFLDPEGYDHRILPDSPLRDAGSFLTRTSGRGRGRELPVEDTYYFYDGFGIRGEKGDIISVGGPDRRARVEEVRHDEGVLVLDRDMRWSAGDPVSLPWSGEAPDMGVYEYGGGRPYAFIEVEGDSGIFRKAGRPFRMRAVLSGIEEPAEYEWHLGDGNTAAGDVVLHSYRESNDYPVRLKVTGADGSAYRASTYLVVDGRDRPRHLHNLVDEGEPLLHSTFNADDEDWWFLWQTYRPSPANWSRELDEATGEGFLRVAAAEEGRGRFPCRTHPVVWDIDRYPAIEIRYLLEPGTPTGVYIQGFRGPEGTREVCLARAPNAPAPSSTMRIDGEKELVDDGEWHDIKLDARRIRQLYPEVRVLEGMYIEVKDAGRIRKGHAQQLGEVIIRPAYNGTEPPLIHAAAATIADVRVNRLNEVSVAARNHLRRADLEFSVNLAVGSLYSESKSVKAGPGEGVVVDFALPFMLDGEHVIRAKLEYEKPDDLTQWERELDFGPGVAEKEFDFHKRERAERIDFPVEIDGDLSEWEDMPYIFIESDSPAEVIKARIYTGWDEHNFYLAVSVEDEKHYNKMEGSRIWDGDSLSFAFVPYEGEAEPVQFLLALAGGNVQIYQQRGEDTGLPEKSEYTVARDDGRKKTFYEMRIPFECIGIEPSGGVMFGFNANINDDDDGSGRDYGIRIASGIGPTWNPANFKSFVLLD